MHPLPDPGLALVEHDQRVQVAVAGVEDVHHREVVLAGDLVHALQHVDEAGAGHDGVMQAFAKWLGPWDEYHVEVDELTDLGDHVLANTRHHGRGTLPRL